MHFWAARCLKLTIKLKNHNKAIKNYEITDVV